MAFSFWLVMHLQPNHASYVPIIVLEREQSRCSKCILDELLLKNGKLGPQCFFGLICQGGAPLLRGKVDPVPEQRDHSGFDVVGTKGEVCLSSDDVRSGSKADLNPRMLNVRSSINSGHSTKRPSV
jgi:hypothetical protein